MKRIKRNYCKGCASMYLAPVKQPHTCGKTEEELQKDLKMFNETLFVRQALKNKFK